MGKKTDDDYHFTKCDKKTSMKAKVVSCEIVPLFRYKRTLLADGATHYDAIDDKRYETVLAIDGGIEVTSYSKKIFVEANPHVGKKIDIPFSFCKMPNGNYLIYA